MPFFSDKSRAGTLKVTIQKFYRIAGGSTQLRGVIPDIIMPSIRDALEIGEDALENPLPYDEIDSLEFEMASSKPLPVGELQGQHEARIATNPDFLNIVEESERLKERIEENQTSLNKELRLAEAEEAKARRETAKAARKARLEEVMAKAEKDAAYRVYKITLDNVDAEELKLSSAYTDEDNTGMRMAKDEEDTDIEDETSFPYGIPPVKMEALQIAGDLVDLLTAPAAAAKVGDKPSGKPTEG